MSLHSILKKGINQNSEFTFCNRILTELYLILRDLSQSEREGDWLRHISAMQSALPFVFLAIIELIKPEACLL